ncbi:Rv1355c family protein [Mongoliitalea lutea]|uniref:THIF-type NAD/FAD binding fold domain-containing protein n=1 Tax=Mongoliitalea lutea TaxID=849756 RepID=A0A8J3CXZ9_9BACT|nr:Rv1355c family protein [Mongoliitalea lutea]GHB42501.1 hypothetical protein GCM10008106_24360 [Mongoliitalea lutea]
MPILPKPLYEEDSKHIILNLTKKNDLRHFLDLKQDSTIRKIDLILNQIEDLIKLQNPTRQFTRAELADKSKEFLQANGGDSYGNWVFYPWRRSLIHILPEKEYRDVRTVRNRYKITDEEQAILEEKKIGVVGLSVGQSVAIALTLERSYGELRIADFDTLELSNLNRLRSGIHYLGVKKTTIVSREVAEIDPYLQVTVFEGGVSEDNINNFLLDGGQLDLLIDECDSLDMKLMMRERARQLGIPVLMDTSDRGMLDIERFDLEPHREIFHGLVGDLDYRVLKDLPMKEKIPVVLKITGLETLSSRMKASLLEVNQSITSWPQDASSVFLGGALGAYASRSLLLGNHSESGRYFVDFDELLFTKARSFEESKKTLQLNKLVSESFSVKGNLKSEYQLPKEKIVELVEFANLAPSGGNVQPWIWIFNKQGVLELWHDQERSDSLLDFNGTGSLLAFGAALENIRIWTRANGVLIEVIEHIREFGQNQIASVVFLSAHADLKKEEPLFDYVSRRITNRLNQKRIRIPLDHIRQLYQILEGTEFELKIFEEPEDLQFLALINGKMDWVRMLNKQGYEDFLEEVRWTPEEAEQTKDGIDLATFDFGAAEKALMKLISNRQAMDVIRKFKLGQGFTKISDDTFKSASAIGVFIGPDFTPQTYLNGGSLLQRIWITANKLGISFQPVTASLFMFHRFFRGGEKDFSSFESNLIHASFNELQRLINMKKEVPLFMFRLNITNGDVTTSYRRDVSDTLKFLQNV